LPALGVSAVMALFVYGLGSLLAWDAALKLLVQVSSGVALYIFGCHMFRLEAYHDARRILGDQFFKSSVVRASI